MYDFFAESNVHSDNSGTSWIDVFGFKFEVAAPTLEEDVRKRRVLKRSLAAVL